MSRRSRKDSDSGEVPDFVFAYADSDTLQAELAEWYTYSEEPEFVWNANAFKNNLFKKYHGEKKWRDLTRAEKRTHVMRLLEQADVSNKNRRETFYRSILYIAQGVFQECETLDDYNLNLVENTALLFECDVFNVFIDLLVFEANEMCSLFNPENKYAPCITDNVDLRVIMSVLYTMLEVIRCYESEAAENRLPTIIIDNISSSSSSSSTSQPEAETSQLTQTSTKDYRERYAQMRDQLKAELNRPLEKTNQLLSIYLFQLINKFCNQNIIVLPIKKIILFLWKTLLFTLGGLDEAFALKNQLRVKFGLPPITENPSFILSQMTPATPPPNPVDLVNEIQLTNPNSSYNKRKKNSIDTNSSQMNGLTKQQRGIDSDDMMISNSMISTSNGKLTQFGFSQSDANAELPTTTMAGAATLTEASASSDNDNTNGSIEELPQPIRDESTSMSTADDTSTPIACIEDMNDRNDDIAASCDTESMNSIADALSVVDSLDAALTDESLAAKNDYETTFSSTLVNDSDNQEISSINEAKDSLILSQQASIEQQDLRPSSPTTSESAESTLTATSTDTEKTSSTSFLFKQFKLQQPPLKCLPWAPKVRTCELEAFLDQERKKFLGYGDLPHDLDTLIGLPYPIHESIRILKQHLYLSLADEQIKLEERFIKYPMSTRELCVTAAAECNGDAPPPAELLFAAIFTNLPQYLICLLKILLTSVPQSRAKNDSLQIMSDLFPEELSGSPFLNVKLGIDTNRHKEILIKAISAILLLMLKHFKINHIYQFEFMCQHLLFANCIPLILKFFNLNISNFIQSKNNHIQLDFPNCVIGEQSELDIDELENGDSSIYRWRNVFSCINLLRILNKLTKHKRSRVMMLVIFKSAPILKKVLRIKQPMLQYYVLKLLKMQTRHLGRQWRKTNMSIMSAIYQKVRHRLNDDWAFGNEQEAQGWDFQSDECALRARIDKFVQRRYRYVDEPLNPDYVANQASLFSSLMMTTTKIPLQTASTAITAPASYTNNDDIPENFATNYETWLDDEVFSNKIDWDLFLDHNSNCYILY